jgi:2-methylcitrate synthase
VTTSTNSDAYSAIATAIGTLRGNLHGGANEAAMEMLEKWTTVQQADAGVCPSLSHIHGVMSYHYEFI